MPVLRHAESRRSETPNAVMTTLASPAQGGASQSVWRVDMHAGASGPVHTADVEQIWTVLDGAATLTLDGQDHQIAAGDTAVIPAHELRQLHADAADGLIAVVAAPAGCLVRRDGAGEPIAPPWTT